MRYGLRGPNFAAKRSSKQYQRYYEPAIATTARPFPAGSEAVICEAGVGGFNAMKALRRKEWWS